jgi:hypothetical protein
LFAALMGAPLMLCSCCVTPIFESIFQRTRRLAPALALMFAAPSLNPAALLLTFLLFPTTIAVGRLGLAFGLVFLVSAGLGLLLGKSAEANETACAVPGTPLRHGGMTHVFLAALWESSRRTLPAIALGVLASAMLAELLPIDAFGSGISGSLMPILIVAAIAVPLALPTFGEIPIALALHAAGAPDGVVLVVLVAGPAINAPSLTILARRISVRAAAITACAVFLIAVAGGSALGV